MSEQHFTTPAPVRLEIRVAAGTVRVESVDGDRSSVTLDGPEKFLDAVRVELIGDRLLVDRRRKSLTGIFERWDQPVQVTVLVPHGSRADITTAASDVTLDGTFGTLDMKSASGSLSVIGWLDGDVTVKTVSGHVRLPELTGDLTVRSVSGDVIADSVGGSVSVRSVSGSVRVGSLREGDVNVQSVSGDVELGIAEGTMIDVDAGSGSGALTSEVPLFATPGAGGGPTVVIRTNSASGAFRIYRAA
jgi:DUF4097 and DUF4098 domain-containing protein YvlB